MNPVSNEQLRSAIAAWKSTDAGPAHRILVRAAEELLQLRSSPQAEYPGTVPPAPPRVRKALARHVHVHEGAPDARTAPSPLTSTKTELLVLSGRGVRFNVVKHYGLYDEAATFEGVVAVARCRLAEGHARAFVAIRIEAEIIDGIGDGTERELARFEVYPDHVVLVPSDQGGLSDEQRAKVLALSRQGLV